MTATNSVGTTDGSDRSFTTSAPPPLATPRGYYMLSSIGWVYNFHAQWYGSAGPPGPFAGEAWTGKGYVVARANGGVLNYGTPWYGSMAAKLPRGVIAVGIAADTTTGGYYLLTSDGRVYSFGAPWLGSPATQGAPGPYTGISWTGTGYVVSRTNGGVLSYGTSWHGSESGKLPRGVTTTGIASDPMSGGYYILTTNGHVYNFGAPWLGSPATQRAPGPYTGISWTGTGYVVSSAVGGVLNYGTPWYGSEKGQLPRGVTAIGIAAP
ncbi:MAG: hypothetical protein ACYDGN_13050 [Acidimicrobiales bacterium]